MKQIIHLLATLVIICAVSCHENHRSNRGSPGHPHDPSKEQVKSNINPEHISEHLEGVINKPKEQMTQDEQNFYYFKLHDYDNNNKLDGLELVSAFAHNEGWKIINFFFF